MDLALLRAFVSVTDLGTISDAAIELGYSQPGLSQRIRTLERGLGCQLFIRLPTGMQLTPTGTAVLPYARILLGVAESMRQEAARAE